LCWYSMMTKYFVYAVMGNTPENRTYAYVASEDAAGFAINGFKPATMTYTGIMVEADSPLKANDVYNRPTEHGGDFIMADEPKEIVMKRKAYDAQQRLVANFMPELKDKLQELLHLTSRATAQQIAVRIAHQLTDLNATLSELARQIRAASADTPELNAEAIYERIKQTYIERFFAEFKYTTDRPHPGGKGGM